MVGILTTAGHWTRAYTVPFVAETALSWPTNDAAGSDIRLNWAVSVVPRTSHTIIFQMLHRQQLGYYSGPWHHYNDGVFHDSYYEWGGPYGYPHDGTMEESGQATGAGQGGPTGSTHYYESAGLSSKDYIGDIQSPRQNFPVTYNVWLWMARSVSVQGANIRHRVYPDLAQSTRYIETTFASSLLESPSSPLFSFGASEWKDSGGANPESPYGYTRGFQWYNSELDIATILAQKAMTTNAAVAAHASCVYVNLNPTHTDVNDKSGLGNHPAWDNSNRPTTYTL